MKEVIWNQFCETHKVSQDCVPLFKNSNLYVQTFSCRNRLLLERSKHMEELVINEVEKVLDDYQSGKDSYEGLIYMMFWMSENYSVIPLYIGKSEKYGRKGNNLSANIHSIRKNFDKFCRWGNNYEYHIGDLSAAVCPGHHDTKINRKYIRWGNRLFTNLPSTQPKLRQEVYFWIKAWKKGDIGIWQEFGSTPLTFLEYLMIGVASSIFPETLLNEEGVNRNIKNLALPSFSNILSN